VRSKGKSLTLFLTDAKLGTRPVGVESYLARPARHAIAESGRCKPFTPHQLGANA
jgi:hypothetical protein